MIATTMNIVTQEGAVLKGDAALAFTGQVADPQAGLASVPSGLERLLQLLSERFGA